MLRSPRAKQKEAYARYCHTLSAAGVIGSLTLVLSEAPLTGFAALRGVAMFISAVLLFVAGAFLSRED
jgi:hypothetical protein